MAWLGWFVGAYVGVTALAYLGQRSVLFPAPRQAVAPALEPGEGRIERIARDDGSEVYAFYMPPADDEQPVIVHFHGNGEQLADLVPLARALAASGAGVLAVEYPGYGLAEARSPCEAALYADADAALHHLEDQLGIPRERTVLQGQSLGSGVAVEMARRGYGHRLVLISPFTSVVDMAARVAPLLPTRWLVRDAFDNAAKVPSLELPALVIHGTRDELIPIEMGRRIAAALPDGQLIEIAGAGHNDLFVRDGDTIIQLLTAFAHGGAAGGPAN